MAETDTVQAAAALTQSILGEFARNGEERAEALLADQDDGAPQVIPAVSSPAPAAEAAAVAAETPEDDGGEAPDPAAALTDFAPTPSEELAALLEEGDWEEEAAAEVAAALESGELDENADPETERQIRALQKRNAFLEERVVQSNRGKWVAENLRAYPLLATYAPEVIEGIDATSRRSFARRAQEANARYEKMLKPALDDVAALKAQAKADGLAEGRKQASDQWGLPVVEPAGAAAPAQQAELERARAARAPLHERIKILAGLTTKN